MIVLAIFLITGCTKLPLKKVYIKEPKFISELAETAPLYLSEIQFGLRRGTTIGRYHGGFLCEGPYGDLFWGTGRFRTRDIELADIFFDEIANVGYNIVGNPNRLFDRGDEFSRAEYRVAGRVTDLTVNLCNDVSPVFRQSLGVTGDAYVKVEWQVYSNLLREVIMKETTEGRGDFDQPVPEGGTLAIQNAFAAAAANFAASARLRDLVEPKANKVTKPRSRADVDASLTIRVRELPLFQTPIATNMDHIRSAVVTIGGWGHGSGFLISEDGLILTNQHVVGDARFIPVQLIGGRQVQGEVLRSHKSRDVALVLIEGNGYNALSLRQGKPLNVGEDVHAIGTPLERALSTTVSRGVVSAFRQFPAFGNHPLIQSDVDIHGGNSGGPLLDSSGNVVGISVAGILGADKRSVGLNFFIPIADALDKLHLRTASLPRDYSAVKALNAAR
ncbi:MAG: S1C family serine protease [Magnetovibrionaceae bacterium]